MQQFLLCGRMRYGVRWDSAVKAFGGLALYFLTIVIRSAHETSRETFVV